jgi:DNA-binding beta-propeller fold protein YncE
VFEAPAAGAVPVTVPFAADRVAWLGEYRAPKGGDGGYVRPHGVAVGPEGGLCVADPGARAVWVHTGDGVADDRPARPVGVSELSSPVDCAFLPGGQVAVADSAAAAVVTFDAAGRLLWRSEAGELTRPVGLAVDRRGERLLVADAGAHRLLVMDFEGRVTEAYGGRGAEPGRFNFPTALDLSADGRICVLDAMNFRVQVLSAEGRAILAFGVAGDGPGTFYRPRGIGVDREGRIYVADALFDNVQVFDETGRLLLALGSRGRRPGEFSMPAGIAVGPGGELYVADAFNRRVQVMRLVAPQAGEVSG